jgi:peptide/nickel transport system substrate-binding protein
MANGYLILKGGFNMRRFFNFSFLMALTFAWLLSNIAAHAATSLVVAQDTPPRMMNPHGDDSDAGLQFMANFFDGLLQRKGSQGELAPALAERWERIDLKSWKFYLRKGVTFHNGNPFTAADVKFSFERLGNPDVSEFLNTGKSIASIDIVDDHTVVIKTKDPIPWFANNMHQIFIMDKESTESRDQGDVMVKPIGTGAYRLEEWVKGSYVRLTANESYWEGAPGIKKVEVRPITESSTRFAALVSGQVSLMTGVPVELFDKIKSNPKLQVISRPARRSIFLALGNKSGSPLADIQVRKAIYLAINENEIIQKIMRGHATPAAQVPDPPTIGYNGSIKRLAYDPMKAKELLKAAGYEKGFTVTLSGPNDRYVQDEKICEAVTKYLAKIGITAQLDVKPKSIFFPQVAKGELEFYLIGWFDGTFDMGRTYFKIAHSRDEAKGYGGLNGAAYSDADIDALLQSTADIVDPGEREKALQKLNKMAMEDKLVWIPLHYQEDLYAVQKGRGLQFQPRPDRWMVYKEISIQ